MGGTFECSGCKSERVIAQVEPCGLAGSPPLLWCELCVNRRAEQQTRDAARQAEERARLEQVQTLVARFREDPGMSLVELGVFLLVKHAGQKTGPS